MRSAASSSAAASDWNDPVPVSAEGLHARQPRLTFDASDAAHLTWLERGRCVRGRVGLHPPARGRTVLVRPGRPRPRSGRQRPPGHRHLGRDHAWSTGAVTPDRASAVGRDRRPRRHPRHPDTAVAGRHPGPQLRPHRGRRRQRDLCVGAAAARQVLRGRRRPPRAGRQLVRPPCSAARSSTAPARSQSTPHPAGRWRSPGRRARTASTQRQRVWSRVWSPATGWSSARVLSPADRARGRFEVLAGRGGRATVAWTLLQKSDGGEIAGPLRVSTRRADGTWARPIEVTAAQGPGDGRGAGPRARVGGTDLGAVHPTQRPESRLDQGAHPRCLGSDRPGLHERVLPGFHHLQAGYAPDRPSHDRAGSWRPTRPSRARTRPRCSPGHAPEAGRGNQSST